MLNYKRKEKVQSKPQPQDELIQVEVTPRAVGTMCVKIIGDEPLVLHTVLPKLPIKHVKEMLITATYQLPRHVTRMKAKGGLKVVGHDGMVDLKGAALEDGVNTVKFWPWEMDLVIKYNSDLWLPEMVVKLVDTAGWAVGLGDRCPATGDDDWGLFHVATDDEDV